MTILNIKVSFLSFFVFLRQNPRSAGKTLCPRSLPVWQLCLTASPLQTYKLSILYIKECVGSNPSIHVVWRKKSGCFFPRERSRVTIIVKRSAGNGVHETVPGATVNRRALRNKLPHECRSSSRYWTCMCRWVPYRQSQKSTRRRPVFERRDIRLP